MCDRIMRAFKMHSNIKLLQTVNEKRENEPKITSNTTINIIRNCIARCNHNHAFMNSFLLFFFFISSLHFLHSVSVYVFSERYLLALAKFIVPLYVCIFGFGENVGCVAFLFF